MCSPAPLLQHITPLYAYERRGRAEILRTERRKDKPPTFIIIVFSGGGGGAGIQLNGSININREQKIMKNKQH